MKEDRQAQLEKEVSEARRSISSDGYPMSIGELTNLYRDGELLIRPEFQRFFRWTATQKSRLIESLLLGIPLPSIFVAQGEGGKWELVDGLQRVSTILQLQGELVGPDGEKVKQLTMNGTKFLPSLEGRVWSSESGDQCLSEAQRLDIKRSKLDIKIIKRESSPEAKFDLFQRLNSYGSSLTAQEMRSALLVAVSSDYFAWIEQLASHQSFKECTMLSERLVDERFDLELVLRFLVLHARPEDQLTNTLLRDFSQVLDEESLAMASRFPQCKEALGPIFEGTFDYIAANGGECVFRKWDPDSQQFKGSFLNTAFEVFALGIGYHLSNGDAPVPDLMGAVREFWSDMQSGYATGKSTEARLVRFVPLGRRVTGLAN